MTKWRNSIAEQKGIVFLMGTENVKDRGGLADFYVINPNTVSINIGTKYSLWFKDSIDIEDTDITNSLEHLFSNLFRLVPKDLLKLSYIIEDVNTREFTDVDELILYLLGRLRKDWGLPNVYSLENKDWANLRKKKKFDLFDKAQIFSKRTSFGSSFKSSSLKKLEKKYKEFIEKEENIEDVVKIKDKFGSEEIFYQILAEYFSGKNVDAKREQLFDFDFSVINKIVNFKTASGPKKETAEKVYGFPLYAFCQMILKTLANSEIIHELEVGKPIEIEVKLLDGKLANCNANDDQSIYENWRKISCFTANILSFLQLECSDQISIKYSEGNDPFCESNYETTRSNLRAASSSDKLTTITFNLQIKGEKRKQEVKWIINPFDNWLEAFTALYNDCSKHLPIFYSKQAINLLNSSEEDTFNILLQEVQYESNDLNKILPPTLDSSSNLKVKLFSLFNEYNEFRNQILTEGFFRTILQEGKALNFIQKYTRITGDIYKNINSFNELERKYLPLYSYLFVLFECKDILDNLPTGGIVLPFHPAMLEKIIDQQTFYRSGFREALQQICCNNKKYKDVIFLLSQIQTQSTIKSGIDLLNVKGDRLESCREVYGFFGMYGTGQGDDVLENVSLLDSGVIFDEEFNTKEMVAETSLSKLLVDKSTEYVNTFPARADSLSVAFINFKSLQAVVAGIHGFINRQFDGLNRPVRLRIQIVMQNHTGEGRNYLNFWLDNFFTEESNIHIETYYKEINLNDSESFNSILLNNDISFISDVMEYEKIEFQGITGTEITPSETRFPMVFHPMPSIEEGNTRNLTVSQPQFKASFEHTQLLYWLLHPDSIKRSYRAEKKLIFSNKFDVILDIVHSKSKWVVCLDHSLDKHLIKKENIISFSTGEGDFGELNMTISSSPEIRVDIEARLKERLRSIFPSWSSEQITHATKYSLDITERLDGIRLLKALNPKDYEVHSYLAYLLSYFSLNMQEITEGLLIKNLIPMDCYSHWFYGVGNRPDFMLIELDESCLEHEKQLEIDITLIECKVAKENSLHVEKGIEQLTNTLNHLQKVLNPDSTEYNRRYWFAQLYRILTYSQLVNKKSVEQLKRYNDTLLKILEGQFKINWKSKLLTYWLDYNTEDLPLNEFTIGDYNVICQHQSYGQLFIQRALLPNDLKENVKFEDVNSEMNLFINDKELYEKTLDLLKEEIIEPIKIREQDKPVTITVEDVKNDDKQEPIKKVVQKDLELIPRDQKVLSDPMNLPKDSKDQPVKDSGYDTSKVQPDKLPSAPLTYTEPEQETTPISKVAEASDDEPSTTNGTKLKNVRLLIGNDNRNQEVYWEYGHPDLENRHILISGTSGVGKTYFIQCLLYELYNQGVHSIVFDYTDGFKKSKLEDEFKESLGDKINQTLVLKKGFPINPFKRNLKELDEDEFDDESDVDIAERIKSVFSSVYNLGPQQANVIYRATLNGLRKYKDNMNLQYLRNELENDGTSYAKTTLSKIEPLIDRDPFDVSAEYNWDKHFEKEAEVYIIQLTGFTREVQIILTEFILWDLWNYKLSHGDKNKPFASIIDEAQNLDHGENSPSAKILTEGRKFGWSGWYATQFLQGVLNKDEIQRLQMAPQKIYFLPPPEEVNQVASYLDTDTARRKEWAKKLTKLGKGECIVHGASRKANGGLEKQPPRIVKVSSFAERINK
ncbi:hypothetical protein CN925_04480 [Bacillus sp. AFS055030]|nr:hypothetical protein CN925_04480 [Bacillus sp. AFS055030]